jgi:hypothetical protein
VQYSLDAGDSISRLGLAFVPFEVVEAVDSQHFEHGVLGTYYGDGKVSPQSQFRMIQGKMESAGSREPVEPFSAATSS